MKTFSGIAKEFMGMAPINYPSSFVLTSLSGSDRSLNNISDHFPDATNFMMSNATRNNFLQEFYKYQIIQLYTHASENSGNNEPVIYFADSLLYLSDLIGENKPLTKLIVLSACETGLGREFRGEGIFSFNRGFAALGIPSSVTNLWTVENQTTYKITELFYKFVAEGLLLDEALQKAKREFIKTSSKEKQLPYYWAAAVLVGSTDRITIEKKENVAYFAIVGIPVLVFILFIIFRRNRRSVIRVPDKAEIPS
jgi:CHAT domain-containing protein